MGTWNDHAQDRARTTETTSTTRKRTLSSTGLDTPIAVPTMASATKSMGHATPKTQAEGCHAGLRRDADHPRSAETHRPASPVTQEERDGRNEEGAHDQRVEEDPDADDEADLGEDHERAARPAPRRPRRAGCRRS